MISLTDLEPEVVSLILELVDDTSPHSTRAVACVNRYLNEITKIISHRHKIIEIKGAFQDETTDIVNSWIEDQTILANIRSLTVKGWLDLREKDLDQLSESDGDLDDGAVFDRRGDYHEENGESFKPLETLLSKVGRLRNLDWNIKCSMPVTIFDALKSYQPASTLRIFNFRRINSDKEEPEPIEERLARCSALTHMRAVVHGDDLFNHASLHLIERAFRLIVASAPKLEYAGFITEDGEILQDHEMANIWQINEAFRIPDHPNESVRNLTLDGVEISKKSLDRWSTVVSLATLETIKFSRGLPTLDYFQCAATMLPNLKQLSLNLLGVQQQPEGTDRSQLLAAIRTYIVTCAPLHTLSLWSWVGIVSLQDILTQHGSSLRSLHLHERDSAVRDSSRILSVEDINAIRDACPNLKSLTLDLQRHDPKLLWDNDSNKDHYSGLAQINQLNKLEIYFDLGARYPVNPNIPGPIPFYLGNHNDASDEDIMPASSTDPTTSPPPAKRAKIYPAIARSHDDDLKPYVQNIWTAVFGTKAGARRLDVKIGDWETRSQYDFESTKAKRHFVVRPPARDDVLEPEVKILRKSMR